MKGLALTRALVREAIANQISFVNATIATSLSMTRRQLRVWLLSRHRDSGDPITLQVGWNFPREGITTREQAISWVVACVRETWVHELHEAIHVDGTRRNDLHVPGTATTKPPPPDLVDPWRMWKVFPQKQATRRDAPKRQADARSVAATMSAVALPDGWAWEPSAFNPEGVVVKAPNGEVTIDFAERGYNLDVPAARYAGRNWRGVLVADAVESLRACMPRRA